MSTKQISAKSLLDLPNKDFVAYCQDIGEMDDLSIENAANHMRESFKEGYEEQRCEYVLRMHNHGLSNEQIADIFEVDVQRVEEWLKEGDVKKDN